MKTRRKFIVDVVEKYKKDNPEDYKQHCLAVEIRRANSDDKKFAQIKGTSEVRLACSVPSKIHEMIGVVLKEKPLFSEKGELRWFLKKYPEFLIPKSY